MAKDIVHVFVESDDLCRELGVAHIHVFASNQITIAEIIENAKKSNEYSFHFSERLVQDLEQALENKFTPHQSGLVTGEGLVYYIVLGKNGCNVGTIANLSAQLLFKLVYTRNPLVAQKEFFFYNEAQYFGACLQYLTQEISDELKNAGIVIN